MCGAFDFTAVSEEQENVVLSPEYQFAKTKQIIGKWKDWGADLRSVCKSGTKYGSLEATDAPGWIKNAERDNIANWANWSLDLDILAEKHKKQSYFSISGSYDEFDNIRTTIWKNRLEKRSILTGCQWRNEWIPAGGIIPRVYAGKGFGHAFKIFGWENDYLLAQLSNGDSIGDKGIFRFPHEVVNREFTYGAFTFKDVDPAGVKLAVWERMNWWDKTIIGIKKFVWDN